MHIGWSRHKSSAVNDAANATSPLNSAQSAKGGNFETLIHQMDKADDQMAALKAKKDTPLPVLKFSNHAVERMSARGIHFTPDEITKMEEAVHKAALKGGKEALLVTKNNAAIVSLKNNTVVTVVDRDMLKNNIFTKIDATVLPR